MDNGFGESLLRATELELMQRDKYVKAFENEYRLTHPLEVFVPATNKDIGSKALVAHISTVAINLTTAGATGTVFYFLELEVLAKEFGVNITNGWIMLVSIIFAIAAVMGIDFTLTSTGLAKGESDPAPYSGQVTHLAAGITAATAGIFRGLLYFQLVPPGTFAETIIKTIVLLAIAVLPVLVLYPAARISGFYMGWVYRENKRRIAEHKDVENNWKAEFQEALKFHVSSRVSSANTLQRKMVGQKQEPQTQPVQVIQITGMSTYIKQAFESLCAEDSGLDPLNIKPSDILERLEAGGVTGIKDGTLRPTIQRIKASILNDILFDMDSSPFQAPDEFCERLSNKFGREVQPDEISRALLTDMQSKFGNR
jgi:hypothetical protein